MIKGFQACDCLKQFETPSDPFPPAQSFILVQYWISSLLQTSLTRTSLHRWGGLSNYVWPTKNKPLPVHLDPQLHSYGQFTVPCKTQQDVSTQRIRSLGGLIRALGATTELCLYLKEINILKYLVTLTQNRYVYWNIDIPPPIIQGNGLLKLFSFYSRLYS